MGAAKRRQKEVEQREDIFRCLWGWNNTIHLLEDTKEADLFLLELDPVKRTLNTRAYTNDESDSAQDDYELAEKETESNPNIQVVLVAVEDLDALRRAYPNYYVDTSGFLNAVQEDIGGAVQPVEDKRPESERQANLFEPASDRNNDDKVS